MDCLSCKCIFEYWKDLRKIFVVYCFERFHILLKKMTWAVQLGESDEEWSYTGFGTNVPTPFKCITTGTFAHPADP